MLPAHFFFFCAERRQGGTLPGGCGVENKTTNLYGICVGGNLFGENECCKTNGFSAIVQMNSSFIFGKIKFFFAAFAKMLKG